MSTQPPARPEESDGSKATEQTDPGQAGASSTSSATISPASTVVVDTSALGASPSKMSAALSHDPSSPKPSSIPPANAPTPVPSPPASSPTPTFQPLPLLTPRRVFNLYLQLTKSRLTTLVVLSSTTGLALSPIPTDLSVLLSLAVGTFLTSGAANSINQLFESPLDAQAVRTRNRPLVTRAISPPHAAMFALACAILGTSLLWWGCNPETAMLGLANLILYAFVYTPLKRLSVVNTWVGAVVGGVPPVMGWTATGASVWPTEEQRVWLHLPSWVPTAEAYVSEKKQKELDEEEEAEEDDVVHFDGFKPLKRGEYLKALLQKQQALADGTASNDDFDVPFPSIALPDYSLPSYINLNSLLPSFHSLVSNSTPINALAPLTLFAILFSWQFPHFNALSHLIRSAYTSSSYHMLCVVSPRRTAMVSLRHSLLLIPICSVMAPLSGAVTWAFAFTSLVPNGLMLRRAVAFARRTREKEARTLFWASLWHLPVVLGLMMVHKTDAGWVEWVGGTWVWKKGRKVWRDFRRESPEVMVQRIMEARDQVRK